MLIEETCLKNKICTKIIFFDTAVFNKFNVYLLLNVVHYAACCAKSSFTKNLTIMLLYNIILRREPFYIYFIILRMLIFVYCRYLYYILYNIGSYL